MSKRQRKQRKSRRRHSTTLPKGSYRLPGGGVMTPERSVRVPAAHGGVDEIVVRGVKRDEPDMKMMARVLLATAKKIRDEEQRDQVG